jgi:hypothetical protein
MSLWTRILARTGQRDGSVIGRQRPHWTRALAATRRATTLERTNILKINHFAPWIRTPVGLDLDATVRGQPRSPTLESIDRLRTPSGRRLSTCVYTMVALTSAGPSSSCGPNVVPILEQVRRERVTEGVWSDTLRDPRLPRRVGDSLLHNRLVQMKPRRWPPSRIDTHLETRETRTASPTRWVRSGICGRARRAARPAPTLARDRPRVVASRTRDGEPTVRRRRLAIRLAGPSGPYRVESQSAAAPDRCPSRGAPSS